MRTRAALALASLLVVAHHQGAWAQSTSVGANGGEGGALTGPVSSPGTLLLLLSAYSARAMRGRGGAGPLASPPGETTHSLGYRSAASRPEQG